MHLDDRPLEGIQRIEDRHRGMGEGAGVDDDPRRRAARFVDPVDDLAFPVRLAEGQLDAEFGGEGDTVALDIREGLMAVDVRLALAEQV